METNSNIELKEAQSQVLDSLIKEASGEITEYRKRQLATFREALIVQALITWGINHLNLEGNISGWLIRILGGLTCFLVGIIGTIIIMAYKNRIYHLRDKRLELTSLIQKIALIKETVESIFFPTLIEKEGKKIENMPTSKIYSYTIIMMGILTLLINILSGFAVKN
jgi:hypothetical protein